MLGLGRASQYAGWWASGPPKVAFTTTSRLAYENLQTPSFSIRSGVGGSGAGSVDINTAGNYNLTNYSSNTEFNNVRYTIMLTIKTLWPTSGISTTDFVGYSLFNELRNNSTTLYYNPGIKLTSNNTVFTMTSLNGGVNFNLPGSYTQYMDRWLTCVWSGSETASSFTNWSNPGGIGNYARMCLFDTVTGEFLGKLDFRATEFSPSIENFPATTPANANGSYGLFAGGFGSGSDPNFYDSRLSNLWASFGTMFDPLSLSSSTAWRTTRPSAVIGTGVAWYNWQFANYEVISGSPNYYYITTSGQDLYSETNNRMAKTGGFTQTDWNFVYSDTNITRDQG